MMPKATAVRPTPIRSLRVTSKPHRVEIAILSLEAEDPNAKW
jgi:hypothetical protein